MLLSVRICARPDPSRGHLTVLRIGCDGIMAGLTSVRRQESVAAGPLPDTPRALASGRAVLWNSDASDQELVDGILADDRRAAGLLYQRYQAHVTTVLVRILGADDEIPDLVHESFLRGFRSLRRLRNALALAPWLSQVATFTALDCLRRRRRRRWLLLVPPEHVDVSVESEEVPGLADRVRAVLERLTPEERVAFGLRFMGEMDQIELAAAMRCSVATAKRRVARAKRRFERLAQLDPVLRRRLGEA